MSGDVARTMNPEVSEKDVVAHRRVEMFEKMRTGSDILSQANSNRYIKAIKKCGKRCRIQGNFNKRKFKERRQGYIA